MPAKCLEIRINSVDDAKSVVQNQVVIFNTVKSLNLEAVDVVVAQEVSVEAQALVRGVFGRIKSFGSTIKPKDGNVLFDLPHIKIPVPRIVRPVIVAPVAIAPLTPLPPKKKTWSRRKKTSVATETVPA